MYAGWKSDVVEVATWVEDIHSKDDPICTPARRLLKALLEPEPIKRPNPSVLGDPSWGTPTCRNCGGRFHEQANMIVENRWKFWRMFTRRYVHKDCDER